VAYVEEPKRNEDLRSTREELQVEVNDMIRADGLLPGGVNPFLHAKYEKKLAIKYVRTDPIGFGKHYCLSLFSMLSAFGTNRLTEMLGYPITKVDRKSYSNVGHFLKDFAKGKGLVDIVLAVVVGLFLCMLYLGFIIGLWISWRRYHNGILIFCLLTVAYLVVVGALTAYARFRLPATPFALPFVGVGFHHLLRKLKIMKSVN